MYVFKNEVSILSGENGYFYYSEVFANKSWSYILHKNSYTADRLEFTKKGIGCDVKWEHLGGNSSIMRKQLIRAVSWKPSVLENLIVSR